MKPQDGAMDKMSSKTITVKVKRFDPQQDKKPSFKEYRVPLVPDMSAMNVLDHIYHNLDGGLAYYDHAACALGACAKCVGKINGKPGLLCQTVVTGDVVLESSSSGVVLKDLVVDRSKKRGK